LPVSERSILAQQLRLLFKSPAAPLGAGITAALALVVLWPSFDRQLLLGWGAATLSWSVMRLVMWAKFRDNRDDDAEVVRWAPVLLVDVTMSGVLLGLFGLAFYVPSDPETRAFIVCVMASLVAGGAVYYAAYLPAHDSFLLTATLPSVAVSLWRGTWISVFTGIIIILLTALTLTTVRIRNRSIAGMIRLQLENQELVRDLSSAKDTADKARSSAEQASRVKSEFLAHMSHELRTPLNAIIGFSEVIKDQILGPVGNERYRSYVTDIFSAGQHLLQLVNDVLDLSTLESGRAMLSEGELDIAGLIRDCVKLVKGQADKNAIHLAVELPSDILSVSVYGDERRLKQVILNLLSNAIKFSSAGQSVTIAAARTGSGELIIAVKDAGIGMEPADIPAALQPFRQLDSALTRRFEGTGLGLPLAKTLVELHGGTLALESAPGAGTAVTVALPKERLRDRPQAAALALNRWSRVIGG
jgi:signal transduction histidine kinase